MYKKITVRTATDEYNVFLQNGFFPSNRPTPRIHKHNYSEIHLILGGEAEFNVGGEKILTNSGDIILIPRRIPHCIEKCAQEVRHSAFQITCDAESIAMRSLAKELVRGFFDEVESFKNDENYSRISAYIALFLSYFPIDSPCRPSEINDNGFLIHEFFSQSYGDNVKLSELASLLHLSERQTERLVLEYTAHTFGEELTATRMDAARYLIENTSLSLTEISEYVGYRSYAGFWKAMKKATHF